jgi:hypothetical protein
MAVSAAGIDVLAFTAGIGEGSATVRAETVARLAFLGVELDPQRNETAEPDCDVATDGSPVRIVVVRAREELVAARAARALLRQNRKRAFPLRDPRLARRRNPGKRCVRRPGTPAPDLLAGLPN